jgi:hypothetical protein
MQIKTRAIENNAVNDEKIRLRNNQSLKGRNNANTADISLLKVNTTDEAEFGAKPVSAFIPSNTNDLVNLGWVQDYVSGVVNLKEAVKCASSANISLAPAPADIDGYTLQLNDRVLIYGQTLPEENGIYVFDGTDLVRSSDFDGSPTNEVKQGSTVDVINGLLNGNKRFILTTENPINLGVDGLTFVEIPTGAIVPVEQEEILTLSAADETNQYVDLANEVLHPSVKVFFSGVLQKKGTDYTLSDVGGVTRISFAGDLATAGAISLVENDILIVSYERE